MVEVRLGRARAIRGSPAGVPRAAGGLAGMQAAAVDPDGRLTPAQRKRLIEGSDYLADPW
jgi:hypothetical protein